MEISSRNPSFVLAVDELDRIVDAIDKRKKFTGREAWQTNLLTHDCVDKYITARWGGSRSYAGQTRRASNLYRKINSACRDLVKDDPSIVWRVAAYNYGDLCFLTGCDKSSARGMAWSLYSWLLPDSWASTRDMNSLEVYCVGVGGKIEVIRRMSAMIKTMDQKVIDSENVARAQIKRAKEIRTRVEAVKLNLLNELNLSLGGAVSGNSPNP
jgi:hypothetical protein